jgi:hypothetical protein
VPSTSHYSNAAQKRFLCALGIKEQSYRVALKVHIYLSVDITHFIILTLEVPEHEFAKT